MSLLRFLWTPLREIVSELLDEQPDVNLAVVRRSDGGAPDESISQESFCDRFVLGIPYASTTLRFEFIFNRLYPLSPIDVVPFALTGGTAGVPSRTDVLPVRLNQIGPLLTALHRDVLARMDRLRDMPPPSVLADSGRSSEICTGKDPQRDRNPREPHDPSEPPFTIVILALVDAVREYYEERAKNFPWLSCELAVVRGTRVPADFEFRDVRLAVSSSSRVVATADIAVYVPKVLLQLPSTGLACDVCACTMPMGTPIALSCVASPTSAAGPSFESTNSSVVVGILTATAKLEGSDISTATGSWSSISVRWKPCLRAFPWVLAAPSVAAALVFSGPGKASSSIEQHIITLEDALRSTLSGCMRRLAILRALSWRVGPPMCSFDVSSGGLASRGVFWVNVPTTATDAKESKAGGSPKMAACSPSLSHGTSDGLGASPVSGDVLSSAASAQSIAADPECVAKESVATAETGLGWPPVHSNANASGHTKFSPTFPLVLKSAVRPPIFVLVQFEANGNPIVILLCPTVTQTTTTGGIPRPFFARLQNLDIEPSAPVSRVVESLR